MMKLKNIQKLGLKVCIKGNKIFFLCNFILNNFIKKQYLYKNYIHNCLIDILNLV